MSSVIELVVFVVKETGGAGGSLRIARSSLHRIAACGLSRRCQSCYMVRRSDMISFARLSTCEGTFSAFPVEGLKGSRQMRRMLFYAVSYNPFANIIHIFATFATGDSRERGAGPCALLPQVRKAWPGCFRIDLPYVRLQPVRAGRSPRTS